ncbi:MAG: triphosphoribosyl-dephospho-CoA synthase [archaeon GB-1867-005]|nr:triphosphoribosyl-dephospho-CoA synthase [Candidatus Culexmicrobium cathedralense]
MRIVKATTCDDAIEACVAIRIAEPGGMGQVKHEYMPDLMNDDFKNRIIQRNLTLYDVMKFASGWDIVAWELVNGLETAFKIGYPALINFYDQIGDINVAIVNTFLKLLSIRPDTLIARKVGLKYTDDIVKAVEIGLERAMEVSDRARKILDLGGLATSEGRKALIAFDNDLAVEGLNPGSTADVLASSIFIAILLGLKI